ncbi:MAG: glutathione S-transferase N-terminal domain-containing protein [Pseudomonadota bacterium]
MIDLYTWTTPNGRKISILLEELGLPYSVHPVHIGKDEQFAPEFLAISPNNKIPAIVDHDGPDGAPISVFESAAIAMYLCDKTSSSLLPQAPRARTAVLEWSMFQMASLGPMFGQLGHFVRFAKEDIPYAKTRYRDEVARILGVMEKQLADDEYLAGEYSIADILCYPWVQTLVDALAPQLPGLLDNTAHIEAWRAKIAARPAVEAGMQVPVV